MKSIERREINSSLALEMVGHAIKLAGQKGLQVCAVVCDPRGHLVALARTDNVMVPAIQYSIDKAWTKLEIGGHFILIINNIRHFPDFIQRMIKRQTKLYASDTLTFSKYLGKIGYTERTKYGYRDVEVDFQTPCPQWIY